MDAPKCRLCGSRHYGVSHIWDMANSKKVANKPMANKKKVANKSMVNRENMANRKRGDIEEPETPEEPLGVTYRYRDSAKRRKYMREYMRRRRAV